MQPPKRLPTNPGPWGSLYAWLNQLLDFVMATAPVGSDTVAVNRTSKGTAQNVRQVQQVPQEGGSTAYWA